MFEKVALRRVLIVDDNLDMAQSMMMLLGHLGHEVEMAATGAQALEVARRCRPQVVFLDIGLPDLDGYEVAMRLRSLEELRPLKIFALTAYDSAEATRRSIAAGFDLHLTKPLSFEVLVSVL
jgi:CheY-like chemotaxis protein